MQTTKQGMSFRTVAHIARFEIRGVVCLYRFWLVALLLSGAALSAYVLSCLVLVNIAPYNVSFIGGTPLYLLGNLDPGYFVFFQVGLLLLVFDCRHRIRRSRLEEVIESQPVRNLEFQLGRTLGYGGLVWGVVCANVLLMQLIGFVSQLFQFDVADTIQPHSMFNLLVVDTPVALLFWTSLFLVLTKLIRSRLLILFASILVVGMYYLLVVNTPFPFVDLVSHSSNQTLFVSDILPELPSTTSWMSRISTLLLVVAILGLGAWIYRRSDSTRPLWSKVIPASALSMGVLVWCVGGLHELGKSNEINGWLEAHLNYEWNTELDVQAIRGNVHINPKSRMYIELDVDFKVTSQRPTESLVFTLNPGFDVSTIEVNGTSSKFDFNKGILVVSVPFLIEPDAEYSLRVVAIGKPNPNFAYLNTPYDYVADTNFPIQALHSFGTEGSIYNREFVALMPGVYWYPIPGTIPHSKDDDSLSSDFFDVDLQIQLDAPSTWKVVGPGVALLNSEEQKRYLLKPNIPIASLGVFASEYVEISHDFEKLKLALYLHNRHARNFDALKQYNSSLLEKIDTYLNDLAELEFPIPYASLALVEVPNKLRTIGGGWRMGRLNSLPGVILLKERSFPTLNVERMVSVVQQDYADREKPFNWMWLSLLRADRNALCSDRVNYGVRDQIWKHVVAVTGEHQRALSLIFPAMVGRIAKLDDAVELFSVYSTGQTTRLTGLNLPSALGIGRGRGSRIFDREKLRDSENSYGARPDVWDRMEKTALPYLNFDSQTHQKNVEVLLLKTAQIAKALSYFYTFGGEEQNFRRWLVELQQEFAGRHFTYNTAIASGRDLGIDVAFLLRDWLAKDTLAGFENTRGTTTQIAPDENGMPRFLFSFDIANTQSTAGYVRVPLSSVNSTLALDGNTAKRVTFTWDASSSETSGLSFDVGTSLSYNRGPIGFFVPTQNIPIDESLAPQDLVEDIIFDEHQSGIVVDDLDAGFSVQQPPPFYSKFRFYPRDWFVRNIAYDIFDGSLFDIGSGSLIPRVYWVRRSEPYAYGKYRRTTAISSVGSSKKLNQAKFTVEIPDSGRWFLDFHVHRHQNFRYRNLQNFVVEAKNGSNRWTEEFYPDRWKMGWKTIGEFDLVAGNADVVIVGTSEPSIVYADAIRWRKNTDQE
ncbi:MAG: hypothetical protein F4X56_04025 [Gammaproteobacteria bacterium]|nr:hypothetical protein [Gammaproteobacteria bacterium]